MEDSERTKDFEALREKYDTVYRILIEVYGRPERGTPGPALNELVGTILSQATTDANTDRAYAELVARFPNWKSVMDAPPEEVIAAIRSAGLANTKGPRIQAALRAIYQERGELSSISWQICRA